MRIFTINSIPGYPLSAGRGFEALAVKPSQFVPTARMRRRHDAAAAWRAAEVFTTAAVAVKSVDHPTAGQVCVPLSAVERSP